MLKLLSFCFQCSQNYPKKLLLLIILLPDKKWKLYPIISLVFAKKHLAPVVSCEILIRYITEASKGEESIRYNFRCRKIMDNIIVTVQLSKKYHTMVIMIVDDITILSAKLKTYTTVVSYLFRRKSTATPDTILHARIFFENISQLKT